MKRTITVATLCLALSALAQGANPVAEWDGFSTLTQNGLTLTLGSDATVNAAGELTTTNASGYENRAYVSLSSLTGDKALSLAKGFTISLRVKEFTTNANSIIAAVASADTDYLLALGSSPVNYVAKAQVSFNGSPGTSYVTGNLGETFVTSRSQYSIITLTTYMDGESCKVSVYSDGEAVGTFTLIDSNSLTSQTLDRLALGGWAGSSSVNTTAMTIDRLAIYSGTMTVTEAKTLYNTWSIPEPTTTTLSLLALAGLAARRRRK